MHRIAIASVILAQACKAPAMVAAPFPGSHVILNDSFENTDETTHYWSTATLVDRDAAVRLERKDENGFMSLFRPDDREGRELEVHRSMDLTPFRGSRLLLSARVRVQTSAGGTARIRFSAPPLEGQEAYSDTMEGTPIASSLWTTTHAVVDVPGNATRGEVALLLKGSGTALFDDVRVSVLGVSPAQVSTRLSKAMNARLTALIRAIALIRFFHPSDQSAALDWDAFSIQAIRTVLSARETRAMSDLLTELFARIAPGTRFGDRGADAAGASPPDREATRPSLPRDPRATHLVRWHHVGLGSGDAGARFRSFRDGLGPDEASAYVYATVNVPHPATCQRAEIRTTLHAITGSPWILVTMYQSGDRTSYIRQQLSPQHDAAVVVRGDVPPDVQQIRMGFYLVGQASVESSAMSIHCENGETVNLDAQGQWEMSLDRDLYYKKSTRCGSASCLSIGRLPAEAEFRWDRDMMIVDIGNHERMVMPIAVWSDGAVTFPQSSPPESSLPDYTIIDLPVRLAAVAKLWTTLSWFYPYFKDQSIDWPSELTIALDQAAAARSPVETHHVLSHLVAQLQDGHAHVRHPAHLVAGMLPVALRRLGERVFVVGGLSQYTSTIPAGSELIAVNGVAAHKLYDMNMTMVSAATSQFRDYLGSLYLSVGPIGAFKRVQIRPPTGGDVETLLPLISRQDFDQYVHIHHPQSGTEVAPSVFYIDPMALEPAALPALISSLRPARAIILDVRGYIKNPVFELLSHLISRVVSSPQFQAPIVAASPTGAYQESAWQLWPSEPHLGGRLIVLTDARAISAAETLLQMVRDNHLATFVGEPTAGTNGNVNGFSLPGGFTVQFTGLRVSAPDGSTIQGHGIMPDHVVHPTLEGIRAGRDEILEAAITLAQQPAPN